MIFLHATVETRMAIDDSIRAAKSLCRDGVGVYFSTGGLEITVYDDRRVLITDGDAGAVYPATVENPAQRFLAGNGGSAQGQTDAHAD